MLLVHGHGKEPLLPQMADPAVSAIDLPSKAFVCLSESNGQGTSCFRDRNAMDVIGHQAISPDIDTSNETFLAEQFAVEDEVVIRFEDLHPPTTSLRDVMGHTGHHNSRNSDHRHQTTDFTNPILPHAKEEAHTYSTWRPRARVQRQGDPPRRLEMGELSLVS